MVSTTTARPRIVIIGAGFGGLSAAHGLAGAPRRCHRHRPAQPPSVPAAALPGGDGRALAGRDRLADPRHPARRSQRARRPGRGARASTRSGATVRLEDRARSPTTTSIVATGARHAYFGHDDWESVAPGLKKHRRRDRHPAPHPDGLRAGRSGGRRRNERRRLLTFVVIGGGPTGVEMAGAIAELAHVALRRDFRNIDPRDARSCWSRRDRAAGRLFRRR